MVALQCRAIRTEKDIYACYPNGKEAYYLLPDEDNNLINNSEYSERIKELRDLCGNEFVDISKEKEFRKSHFLWEYIDLLPEGSVKW